MLGLHHDFFKPIWRRVATVGLCIGWGAFELHQGQVFWGVVFVGVGLVSAYEFFWNRNSNNVE